MKKRKQTFCFHCQTYTLYVWNFKLADTLLGMTQPTPPPQKTTLNYKTQEGKATKA